MASLGSSLVGPIRCEDGWHSPSIGRQGACSHHGGVDDSAQKLVGLVSTAISVVSGLFVYGWLDERQRRKWLKQHENDPICPEHKVIMKKKMGYRGEFWGCPRYPYCRITKSVKAPEE